MSESCPNCGAADGCDCDPYDVLGAVVEQHPIPSGRGYPSACSDCVALRAELAQARADALEQKAAYDAELARKTEALKRCAWNKGKRLEIAENQWCGSCDKLMLDCDRLSEFAASFGRDGCAGWYARRALTPSGATTEPKPPR